MSFDTSKDIVVTIKATVDKPTNLEDLEQKLTDFFITDELNVFPEIITLDDLEVKEDS